MGTVLAPEPKVEAYLLMSDHRKNGTIGTTAWQAAVWGPVLRTVILVGLVLGISGGSSPLVGVGKIGHATVLEADSAYPCLPSRWQGSTYGLKDHTIFYADGYYYGVSIYLGEDTYETQFAYARSRDLCTWTELPPILTHRQPGAWDEFRIWAPHVIRGRTREYADTYFMYYTGVTNDITQSMMLATTKTPADPDSWQPRGMVFQPNHEGMVWPGRGQWSDARDPMVYWKDGRYYMYYSGADVDGGIVGLAQADNPYGPWTDMGSILTLPGAFPESPTLLERKGFYFMAFNQRISDTGEKMVMGLSPTGPWNEPWDLEPGWAHEFFKSVEGNWLTSYLTDYSVTIDVVDWEQQGSIEIPVLRDLWEEVYLPQILLE